MSQNFETKKEGISMRASPAHSDTQEDQLSGDASPSSKRRRIKRACDPCRKRKRKCDGLHPCSQCSGYEYQCAYVQGDAEVVYGATQSSRPTQRTKSADTSDKRDHHCSGSFSEPRLEPPAAASTRDTEPSTAKRSAVSSGIALVDPIKGRFSFPHSSVVFAHKVGQQMNLPKSLKLHSYGWNLGIRPQPPDSVRPAVRNLLTFREVRLFGGVYFDVVDPVHHFVDRARFFDRSQKYWLSESPALHEIEALISGIVALGSFFSAEPCALEGQLVQHAMDILNSGHAHASGSMPLDRAASWVLRTLYLRLTTRPHWAWHASCSAVHVAESAGLYIDLSSADLVGTDAAAITVELIESRRNIFQCAIFLNTIISAEYGRSKVVLQDVSLAGITRESKTTQTNMGRMLHLMARIESLSTLDSAESILEAVCHLPNEPPAFVLVKTDIALFLYRNLVNSQHETLSKTEIHSMLSIINSGLSAARDLVPSMQAWWNLLSTPFQSFLMLVAMDSSDSLVILPDALAVLIDVHNTFKTHMTLEIVQTAKGLIQGLERRKYEQAGMLSGLCDVVSDATAPVQLPKPADEAQKLFQHWTESEADWDSLFGINFDNNFGDDFVSDGMPNFP